MLNKKQKIIFYSLFLSVFAILLLIATFFDYQITDILARKGLNNGAYYSSNEFGRIFEAGGEMPIYLFIIFGGVTIAYKCEDIKNTALKIFLIILFAAVAMYGSYYGLYKFFRYLSALNPEVGFFKGTAHFVLICFLSVLLVAGCYFIERKFISKEYKKQFFQYAVFILTSCAISQLVCQAIKIPMGRERYRTIYYLGYLNVESQGFTRWYVANGNCSAIAASFDSSLNVIADYFKSFPSGHTCAAAIVYTLLYIPYFFKKTDTKRNRIILFTVSLGYTGIVAVSRMVMGAHYMSDVLVGGTITFASCIAAFYIITSIFRKIESKTK